MVGDEGPYINDQGDVWVPRTIPYLEARRVARTGDYYVQGRLVYLGKSDADLLGFTRQCRCDEVCQDAYVDDEPTGDHPCRVPAWHFRLEER